MSELVRRSESAAEGPLGKAVELAAAAHRKAVAARQDLRVALSVAELRAEAEIEQDRRDRRR
ncbi:hypothetical protein [Amycolatopsis sp. FDAARGOS 1241]|uniref:hypothetical protein n=1 Tax=Amycolatopsis sp. FDAARGOS 1241 TaxID=2778070 RepID=UPI00194FF707|nr:hypothetical protein [Amycolatopsis sp. FDAARGOS 1241]QRP46180.1 hypothetical protein I6J71_45325 [Amycolatopsis sp. FDAARGOS 1241]